LNPITEVQLVAGRELRKSVRSAKGLLLAGMSLVGGTGVALLLAWVDRKRRTLAPPDVDLSALQEEGISKFYGAETGHALATAPYSLLVMLVITLWLSPLLIALLGFDSIAGELQHRTARYWVVRTRRSSYIAGKFLGSWVVLLAVLLGMNVIVWGATAVVGGLPLGQVIGWGIRFFGVCVPVAAAWCGIAVLVGSQVKTPIVALLLTCLTFFLLWFVHMAATLGGQDWVSYVYPNAYDRLFLSPKPMDLVRGLGGTAAIALVTTTAAALLFERRDL
jgi:ABC-type transport system involved in multi-copper enzyme maturation permease subunit